MYYIHAREPHSLNALEILCSSERPMIFSALELLKKTSTQGKSILLDRAELKGLRTFVLLHMGGEPDEASIKLIDEMLNFDNPTTKFRFTERSR